MKQLSLNSLAAYFAEHPNTERMPAMFLGHGNPMNAIEDNEYRAAWKKLGEILPQPKAIVCISAHWYTRGTLIMVNEQPKTIHDFYGFPEELFRQQYPAPGSPELAGEIITALPKYPIQPNTEWGLDHGTWAVLQPMFPDATIPVIQISINGNERPEYHYNLARELAYLRSKGVMIVGSGNIVHNLRMMRFDGTAYEWAKEFDTYSETHLLSGNDTALIQYENGGTAARYSIPTEEHYLPLLYVLGVKSEKDSLTFFNTGIDLASVSMRSVLYA